MLYTRGGHQFIVLSGVGTVDIVHRSCSITSGSRSRDILHAAIDDAGARSDDAADQPS